jgi:putative nucleotidyltransferase with HDIG domain
MGGPMGGRRLWLKLYVGATIAAGAAALAATAHQWSRMELGVAELALFIGLAGILDAMVVPVAGGGAMAASFAVFFGGVLALGAQPTAWVAALAVMWSEAVVRRRPLPRACFNASHSVLSLLAAGWVYRALGAQVGWVELTAGWPAGWPAVVAAAVVLWALETGWASVAVALERGGRLWRRLRSWLGPGLAWDGGLASVGLLLALLYQSRWQLVGHSGWQGALLLGATVLIPSALLYYAYRLQGSLQQVYSQSLRTLGSLLEAKVEGSQPGHGERVARLAARLAESLELPPRDVEQIRYAAYLHDIGKVGVPSTLLARNPDRLSAEPEAVRLHAQIGAAILSPIRFLQPAAQFVTSHHERWDGLGYPQGLRQKQIPLGARVLALADAYVGLTHSPLPPLPLSQTLSLLQQAAGSRFDPELVAEVMGTDLARRDLTCGPFFEPDDGVEAAAPETSLHSAESAAA